MQDLDKLGVFYLGREVGAGDGAAAGPLLYDSKDLTTHAVCVGMTGSGKTGLCISLLEEAALASIPALVIDPKGDIATLLLAFPDLAPADFELPLRDLVVFPHMVAPVFLSQDDTLLAVEEAQLNDQTVIALTQRDPEDDEPGPGDFYPIGVEIAIGRLLSMPDGSSSALVQGRRRVEVIEFVQEEPFQVVRVRPIYEDFAVDRQTDATMRTALEMFQKCVQLDRSLPEEAYLYALNIEEPGWLADMIVTAIAPPLDERVEILEQLDPYERLKDVIRLLAKEADVLELEDQIHTRAQSEVDRSQRAAWAAATAIIPPTLPTSSRRFSVGSAVLAFLRDDASRAIPPAVGVTCRCRSH